MRKITRKHQVHFLKRYSTTEMVLEIGGGRVTNNHYLEVLFPNRHTLDIDPLRKPDTVGDVHELPFEDSSFNFILCSEVLEHLHTPQLAIDEMYRVLKPGGKLILTTRFVYPIHDAPHDYFRYTKYGLQHLFKDWELIELIPETQTFSAIGALLQRIGFQSDLKGSKLSKGVIYCLAFIFEKMNFLLVKEYGDIKKINVETSIITTGYYLSAIKK